MESLHAPPASGPRLPALPHLLSPHPPVPHCLPQDFFKLQERRRPRRVGPAAALTAPHSRVLSVPAIGPPGDGRGAPPQRESANSRRTGAATVRRHAGRPCRPARPAAAAERPGHCGRHEAPLSPGGSVTADTASPRQSPCGEHKAPSAG